MNRIDRKFSELRKKRKKAFIPFVTAGDPDLATTRELVLAFEKSGADIVELGIPFSDPLADGPTIQASSLRALNAGVTTEKIFRTVAQIRRQSQIPIVFLTYYNPVFHYGESRFIARAKEVGVDGLVIPDLPPEEAKTLTALTRKSKLANIFLLSPVTTPQRRQKIIQAATGFIYYVSITGVTGARRDLPSSLLQAVKLAKTQTDKPIWVGFGVSTPAQVRAIARVADGVIVGSAIVKEVEKNRSQKNLVQNVSGFVKRLSLGLS